jgi:tetratricopeptide (TPR) repeat protein
MVRPLRSLTGLLLPALVLCGTGCSTGRDAFLNRAYHRLTSRDNGWFNANEKLKEVVSGIEEANIDNYDEVLPVFVYGTEEQCRNATPDLEKCIDKCSLVIERHSMDIEGKERNRWIDDAWMVIARSNFHKRNYYEAERGFTYISRRFKDGDRRLQALEWTARTAIELEQYAKAQSALDQIREEKKLPKHFDHGSLSAVLADLDLRRGKVDDAILHLERAVEVTRDRDQRTRWAFILAQLYQVKGFEEKAISQFGAVVRMNPPYEMAFHAQIFQALAFNKGDSKALRQKLNRMLRDEKHMDHFDMIHYALADLDLKERRKEEAVDHLETSARVSTTDSRQKAKSFMKLADLSFEDRVYARAQKYYDSTRTLLAEDHPRFAEVSTRAEVLGDLVEQLGIIALEDSLQGLAQLDDAALQGRIKDLIRGREKEEEEKRLLEERAREQAAAAPDKPATEQRPTGARGGWYFYDAQQIGRGLAQFRKRWGNRPLEDDWRRKDKSGSITAETGEGQQEGEGESEGSDTPDGEPAWKDPSFYLKDLPKDADAIAASNARICEALYISGMIYKEQLKDMDNATESFEVLNNRFDDCRYTPESYYQLYRIFLEKESSGWFSLDGFGARTYADIILERWPDSEFARLVRDPNVLQADEERRKAEEEAYRRIYQQYRQYSFIPVVNACEAVLRDEPRNHFRPKYHILKAMALGGLRDMGAYRSTLTELKSSYPGTDEAKAADELLAALDKGTGGGGGSPKAGEPTSDYSKDDGAHFYAVVVPNKGSDLNSIKLAISDFGRRYLPAETFQVTTNFLDNDHQVVLVDRFSDRAAALAYHALFVANTDMLSAVKSKAVANLPVSTGNYTQLFRSKDLEGYRTFFTGNFLEGQ